jgi:uncharacterized protein YkwD
MMLAPGRSPRGSRPRSSLIPIVVAMLSVLALSACAEDPNFESLSATYFSVDAIEAVNQARAEDRVCGTTHHDAAPPVRWDGRLADAAMMQVEFLQKQNLFTHEGEGGSRVGDRALAAGYDWVAVGENLAAGHTSLESVIADWIKSPSHCSTLMRATYVDAGIALVPGTRRNEYRSYWALVLGRPRN